MSQYTVIFANYYDSSFLADGTTVNVYALTSPGVLVDSAIIGVSPNLTFTGQATFNRLVDNLQYSVYFVDLNNLTTGPYFLNLTGLTGGNLTVPFYHQTSTAIAANLYTFTNLDVTLPNPGSLFTLSVIDSSNFIPNQFVLVSNTSVAVLAIINSIASSQSVTCIVSNILAGSPASVITSGSLVSLFAPNNFKGLPGNPGIMGSSGPPGHGATITTAPILVAPIGTLIQLIVENNTAFPIYQYVLITDNVYAITGQVQVVDLANKILGVRIYSVQNATVGSQIQPGASVTFSGPPGPPGTLEQGSPGTVFFKDLQLPFNTTYFNTGSGILTNASLGPVLQLKLPGVLENGLSPNFRVEVELNGAMATNQMITSSNAYLGIGTTTAPIPGTASRIFSGYLSPPQPASTIPNATCLGDAPLKISQPGISGAPCIVKFYGTYAANTTLAFSVLATAQEPNATLYVSAELTIKAYPIYN